MQDYDCLRVAVTHREKAREREGESFRPVILLAQPAELKTRDTQKHVVTIYRA